MGSGLILLVIVGAWLAVLVPMALRSHDSTTSLRSTDRFNDAMRVLSRRGARDVVTPNRGVPSFVVSQTRSPRPAPVAPSPILDHVEHLPLTAAQRRARTLLALLGLSITSLGLALLGVPLARWVQVLCDLLLVAFVVHLRRTVKRSTARRPVRRAAPVTAAPVRRRGPRIAGIPDRMPARPAPLTVPLPAPAARYEDRPIAVTAATGTDGTWSPVPVPPPSYVGKARAPRPDPRVLDLTKPGEWTAALDGEDAGLGILDEGPEIDEILTRRRAAGGW